MMIKSQVGGLPLPSMNASSFNDIDFRNRVELQQQLEGEKEKLKKLKEVDEKVIPDYEGMQICLGFEANKKNAKERKVIHKPVFGNKVNLYITRAFLFQTRVNLR